MLRAVILAVFTLLGLLTYLLWVLAAYFLVRLFLEGGWGGIAWLAGMAVAYYAGKYILLLAWSSVAYRRRRLARVTVLVPRPLEPVLEIDRIEQWLEESAEEAYQTFGKPLLRPVVILASPTLLMRLRCEFAGFALPYTVVLNPIHAGDFLEWRELIRHEMAHVATYRLLFHRPPALLQEGLAMYWARTESRFPVDAHALAILSEEVCEPLFSLHDKAFHQPQHVLRNYILAGSFVGYLVRCVGWKRFLRFYLYTPNRYWIREAPKTWGKSVWELEQEWRKWLAQQEELQAYLPQLRHYWRIVRLASSWRWEEMVPQAEEYLQRYGWNRWIATMASEGYFLLRQWERCAAWSRRLAEDPSATGRLQSGEQWLRVGCCYDMQGRRAEAIEAYQRTLQELPVPAWNYQSTHTVARRCLKTAFGEKQFAQYVQHQAKRLLQGMEA